MKAIVRSVRFGRILPKVGVVVLILALVPLLGSGDNALHSEQAFGGQDYSAESLKPQTSSQPGLEAYGRLPVSFIPNAGQTHPTVLYYSRGRGYSFSFSKEKAVFVLPPQSNGGFPFRGNILDFLTRDARGLKGKIGLALALRFIDANPQTRIEGRRQGAGKVNYFIGKDPSKWRIGLPTYQSIIYRHLWPGVDMIFRGENGQLKYEFIIQPGASVEAIQLAYDGALDLSLDENGNLRIATQVGELTDHKPVTYQVIGKRRVSVESQFVLRRQADGAIGYGFVVGDFNARHPLIIDPGLVYSTFLGGGDDDAGHAIAVDRSGNAYITGETRSLNFPTSPGAFDPSYNGDIDAFVTKLDAAGASLVYSTYLGGFGGGAIGTGDAGHGIAVDLLGNAYITGETDSGNFPTTPGAFDTTYNLGSDAFVTKLNATGGLAYSTYLGGGDDDFGRHLFVRGSNAYVTGKTNSFDFPTTNGAFDQTYNGNGDGFATKVNATGSNLVYSTYLGGFLGDSGRGITVDGQGHAYITGETDSVDFPTTIGAFDTTYNLGFDAYVSKFDSVGANLLYSTYLGGPDDDSGGGISLDRLNNAFVTGSTSSFNFPTTSTAFDQIYNGNGDAFVSILDAAGATLSYSTFLGGVEPDAGRGIAADRRGNAAVTGATLSPNFPTTTGAFDTTYNANGDAFVVVLNPAQTALLMATFLGGISRDSGADIAIRGTDLYVTGATSSPNFPVTAGAFDTSWNLGSDAFVSKLALR